MPRWPRSLSAILPVCFVAAALGGCSGGTPKHPEIQKVPDSVKTPPKDPSFDPKNPPKYKAQ